MMRMVMLMMLACSMMMPVMLACTGTSLMMMMMWCRRLDPLRVLIGTALRNVAFEVGDEGIVLDLGILAVGNIDTADDATTKGDAANSHVAVAVKFLPALTVTLPEAW